MARLNIKYTTPKVFNIDQARKRIYPISAVVGDDMACNILYVCFSEYLDIYSVPDEEDFSVSFSGGNVAILAVQITVDGEGRSQCLTITLDRLIFANETGTVTYSPGITPILSEDGLREAAAFTVDVTTASSCTTTSTEDFAPFMITIDTTKAGSANDTFILPITAISGDYDVDWGDGGAIETFTTIGNKSHTYSAPGTYQISISGGMTALSFYPPSDRLKLIYIDQWGDIAWSSMYRAFYQCSNMIGRYTDIPDTSAVQDMSYMFAGCSLFNQAVNFDTSAATNMTYMFYGCSLFNQSLATFNTSLVQNMSWMFNGCINFNQSLSTFNTSSATLMIGMFYGCSVFNQSVSSFNTENVTSMYGMFASCTLFNQSVANFDTSQVESFSTMFHSCPAFNQSVANFNTSSATTMSLMFYGCTLFNQSVANFDTSLVNAMQGMFYNCINFNQSVANFDTSSVYYFSDMFYGCSSFKQSLATFSLSGLGNITNMLYGCDINAPGTSTNYDDTLIAWAAADVPNNKTFHGGTSKYSDTGQTARTSLINDDLWLITSDGGHI